MSIDELIIKFDKMGDYSVHDALTKSCLVVETAAKNRVPYDTGNLGNSITYVIDGDVGIVGTNVEYAPYVEFGTGLFSSKGDGRQDVPWRYQDASGAWHTTSGQQPQPYLQPALQKSKKKIAEIFKNSLKEAMK